MKNAFLIGLAVIVLIAAGVLIGQTKKSDQPSVTPTPTSTATTVVTSQRVAISIIGMAFSPADITITKGATVTWTNNDTMPHSIVSSDNVLGSKAGESYEHTFNDSETVSYRCGIHPFMSGTIQVVEK
jgi:plastocyanin